MSLPNVQIVQQSAKKSQEEYLADILKSIRAVETASSIVLYDATWDFVGTMEALEDTPGSGNWYWGGYNSDTDNDVFYDYGWTVSEYDTDSFGIVDSDEHVLYSGAQTIGLPFYVDNSGKLLGKSLIVEITSVGHATVLLPGLDLDTGDGYVNAVGSAFELSTIAPINEFENVDDTTFVATLIATPFENTAQEIAAVFSNGRLFQLQYNQSAIEDASFTVTSPIRVRILMQC